VAEQTRDRIRDIVPPGALGPDTRLALINAVYFKAPWATPFDRVTTKLQPFHVQGGAATDVTTMWHQSRFGYRRFDTFRAVAIPYSGGSLQFLVLVPDAPDGLAGLEASLTPETLRACATLPVSEVELYLPKFKLQPPTVPLSAALQQLGMKSAFDRPLGSADFDRMTPRKPADYLYLSEVFHKTFLSLDEEGTEAAAATAAVAGLAAMRVQPQVPVEVRVDRPFFYAIQHVTSGACLFIGHVVDPR
jgi:serpin B